MSTIVGNLKVLMTMNSSQFVSELKKNESAVNRHTRGMTSDLDSFKRSILGIGKTAAAVAPALAVLATGFVMEKSIEAAGEFQTELANMVKVTDESTASITKSIESIDPALGSSTELVKGYYATMSAGVKDPVQALNFLTEASKFAKSAHISQESAITSLAKVMNGYSGDLKNTAQAADLLYAIEAEGITKVEALIPIIGDLASYSKNMAVETYEMGGALAHLTKVSGSTSEASTKLTAIYTGLLQGQGELTDAYKSLGVASGKALIEQNGMVGALQELEKYAESTGRELHELFSRKEAIIGVTQLASGEFENLTKSIDSVKESTGGAERAWQEYQGTWAASKELFQNTINKMLVRLGNELLPQVTEALNNFSNWFNENGDTIVSVTGKILGAVVQMASGVGQVIGALFADMGDTAEEQIDAQIAQLETMIQINKQAAVSPHQLESIKQLEKQIESLRVKKDDLRIAAQQQAREESNLNRVMKNTIDNYNAIFTTVEKIPAATNNLSNKTKQLTDETKKYIDLDLDKEFEFLEHATISLERKTGDLADISREITTQFEKEQYAIERLANAGKEWADIAEEIIENEEQMAEEVREAAESAREALFEYGSFFDGMKLGWAEVLDAQMTWAEEGYHAVLDFVHDVKAAVGDTLYSALKGDFDEIGDIWNSLLDSMLATFTDMIAKMIVKWATAEIFGGGTGSGDGGIFGSLIDWASNYFTSAGPGTSPSTGSSSGSGIGGTVGGVGTTYAGYQVAAGSGAAGAPASGAGGTIGAGSSTGAAAGGSGYGAAIGGTGVFAIAAAMAIGLRSMAASGISSRGPRAIDRLAAYEAGQDMAINPRTGRTTTGIMRLDEDQLNELRRYALLERQGYMQSGYLQDQTYFHGAAQSTLGRQIFEAGELNQILEETMDIMAQLSSGQSVGEILALGEGGMEGLSDDVFDRLNQYQELLDGAISQTRDAAEQGINFDSLNDLAAGNFADAMAALNVVQDVNGWSSPVTLDFIARMDDAEYNVVQRLSALGFIGDSAGWTSEATLQMITQLSDAGIPWNQIENILRRYGVEDEEIIKQIRSAYESGDPGLASWSDFVDAVMMDIPDTDTIKEIVGQYNDRGIDLEDLMYMLEESGVPEDIIRRIQGSLEVEDIPPIPVDAPASIPVDITLPKIVIPPIHVNVTVEGGGLVRRAKGGPVHAGSAYIVGEVEPEIFIPSRSGTIINSDMLNRMNTNGGGVDGNKVIEVHNHIELMGEELREEILRISEENRVEAEEFIEAGNERTTRIR